MLEREIQKINKKIDLKILQGHTYKREAMEHKLLLKKVRYHSRRNFWNNFFQKVNQANRFASFF